MDSRDGVCFHCGESLPPAPMLAELDGQSRPFCCDGCAAAAHWILDAQLDDYYRLRDVPAGRVDADAPALAAWDREELLAGHARAIEGGREITVLTDGMRCAACAWLIDRALAREPGVLDSSANAITGRIRIAWDPARTVLSQPLARLAALGYRPYLATGEEREATRRRQRNRDLIRIGLAGIGAMQAMMFAEALYLDTRGQMPIPTRDFFRWITFLVSTPVVFWAGWPFLLGAWNELRGRRLGMDVLIAGSTLLAWAASTVETLRGGPHVWFDAAVMFVFLLLVARQLEQRARGIASAQVDALARARPAFATRELDDGRRESVPIEALAVGDRVRVAVGEPVPADGVLLDGDAAFEESLLTGESTPVAKHAGDPVYAGTACREHAASIRITQVGAATRLAELVRLVETAQAHRPALARGSERIATWFVAGLALAALVVYAWWRLHEPARAFEVVLALLVISCPCALSLAVPAALAAAHGALAKIGVLAVRPDALERLARVSEVVFDKTGTLTCGKPQRQAITDLRGLQETEALRIAAALERDSSHPLAAAFADCPDPPPASNIRAVPGQGVEGVIEGRRWRIGSAPFAIGSADDGTVWLGGADGRRARFLITERVRNNAAPALQRLREQGLCLRLASGDAEPAVTRLARELCLEHAHARQSPEDKLALVRQLQNEGKCVAMVGDGLNDAPVLAGADVSLAIGDGAALAQRSADFVLAGSNLGAVPAAISIARRSRRVIRENLGWAIGYNLLALPLAAAGMVTPWLAALGMALSSLLVTANALRLTRVART
ncbi:heavy metal translocating P-type ATPase [Thermomonas sp.]|uniref:heavy metal translocating P-type ATPase n=1 Tax=Thermomonas sp. TaxID=1971895 RepID=UPI0026127851|nr:heavy metal translocating P-type ATPase [Thermomonas sp.]MCO5054449.1 cadmium-translocating P-type ATPase [Thermomonas sp.]